jgi:hypothetical protein
MRKSVFAIDKSSIQRSFFGTHDRSNPSNEHWYEAGHYYKGVELAIDEVFETDGAGREAATIDGYEPLGYLVTGSGEPAQNDDVAINFYRTIMRGTRNFAVLTGSKLLMLRLVNQGGTKWQDNRISVATAIKYSGHFKGSFAITGHVDDFELIAVDPASVKIKSGRLIFHKVENGLSADTTGKA